MNKILLLVFLSLIIISSCQMDKLKLKGNVFLYQDGTEKQFVGFGDEEIYLKWDDSLGVDSYQGKYTINYINDTTAVIELQETPKFWESNTWKIIIDEDKGFYSEKSKKYYKPYKKKIDNK